VELGLIIGNSVAILFAVFHGNNVLRRDTQMPEMLKHLERY
jgi:hypothetical protein